MESKRVPRKNDSASMEQGDREAAEHSALRRPLLLLDIDGTLVPLGPPDGIDLLEPPVGGDHAYVRYRPELSGWMARLAEAFELVWATSWGVDANHVLSPLLGLPPLPVVPITDEAGPGETLKLPAIRRFVGERPFAWIDDDIGEDARTWVDLRVEVSPGHLVMTQADRGIDEGHVHELLEFAEDTKVWEAA